MIIYTFISAQDCPDTRVAREVAIDPGALQKSLIAVFDYHVHKH